MSLFAAIERDRRPSPLSVPELRYLSAAANRVRERWPDVQLIITNQEREALAQKLREHVERNDWREPRLSFVVLAASAVFDPERRERTDMAETRDFLYAETAASTSETFLSGMLRAYIESYAVNAGHTIALAKALSVAQPRMSASERRFLVDVPEFLDIFSGPDQLAARMTQMSEPYAELLRLGVRNPHAGGFMDLAHVSFTELVRPTLTERKLIDWYIRWLRPEGKEVGRNTGSKLAIEALIHPWMDQIPDDKIRSHLVETLIELYGDPRIKSGGVWSGIDDRYMAIVQRWLTREDMRFFTGVVDAVQKDNMWVKRRDFWLKLYDEGLIDAAWAALSSEGFEYARQHLMRQDAKNAYTRVGFQRARKNTSLLIMKIGNKIMVDGCHSYRTHVFEASDPMAPKLYEEGYDCASIMIASDDRRSVSSKSHSSIDSWGRWVRDMINADVDWSQRKRPYPKVLRPRPPKTRYVTQDRSYSHRNTDPRPSGVPERVTSGLDFSNGFGASLVPSPSGGGANRYDTGPSVTPVRSAPSPFRAAALSREPAVAPDETVSRSASTPSFKAARFSSLTDRMIAYGPNAALAVLEYLEAPTDSRTRPLLSPKSREGLAWVRAVKEDLPLSLSNALEHLLINLKTSGVDLDDLFSTNEGPSGLAQTSNRPNPIQQTVEETSPETGSERYPLMPNTAEGRLEHLVKHVDALEEVGMSQGKFEQRKAAVILIKALRERPSDLLPAEIMDLMSLYDRLIQKDLDALIVSSAATASVSDQLAQSATAPRRAPVSEVQKLPPLPGHPDGRLDLLCEHVDAIEDLGIWKRTFEQRKAFRIVVQKLKERSPDLRPTEIADLQSLYEELRQGGKGKRK